ncbi:hypothetical protein [Enterococcus sp. OL5]|uniref:hypothetical protein n=1 Tax=Enterococcus sp. OL5 TaxID=2590214 RepID=UPI0011275416|nr:hypothetical protein [Enterococcus sp. OL5]TPR55562.1 hypothetical protein FJU10_16290 [Enterococcus sp. OL5]
MNNIFYSEDGNYELVKSFMTLYQQAEKSYDQDRIILWMNHHAADFEGKKVWLLTGIANQQTLDEWTDWLRSNEYDVVIDCRGFGQALLGNLSFHYSNLKKHLESQGIQMYSLEKD